MPSAAATSTAVEARLLREVAERAPLDLVVSLAGRIDDLSALADLFG